MEFDYPHSSPTSPPSSPTTTFQHHRRERPILGHAKTHFTTSTTTRKVLVSLCLLCLSVLLVAVGASAEPEEQTSLSSSLCDPDGPLALGMESGAIADSALSASSAYEMLHVGPNNARLKTDNAGGAWCPQKQLDAGNSGSEWIQVDLGASHVITGVATQGRYGKGMGQEFTEAYRLLYSRANAPDRWILWRSSDNVSNLEGNLDANTVEEHHLEMAIVGVRRLRLVPLSNYTRTVCLRFELYGCPYYGPISYSTPVPSSSSNGTTTASSVVDSRLLDTLYDGALGKLTDGVKPLPGATGVESPPDRQHSIWLAWPPTSSGSKQSTSTVPLVFEFDGLSNCSTVAINALNRFSSSVRVFSLATIAFSLDGRRWSEAPVRFHYQADNVIQLPRDVLIHLQYRIGRFVRIELTYSAEWWLQLSEVAFDCRPVAAELLANLTSAQLEALFSRLNSPAYNYAADASSSSSSSSSSGTRYTMDHHQNSEKNSLATLLVPAPHGGSGAINWNIPWKLSLVIISLCAIGLVLISLLASFALKKLHHRKTLFSFSSSNSSNGSSSGGPSLFLTSENGTVSSTVPSGVATINLKSVPADESSSPLYCEPKEFAHQQNQQQYDPEYAIPDAVICAVGGNLSKTLHYGQLLQPNSGNYQQHHHHQQQQQQHHLHQQNHHHQLLLQQQQNGSKANAISCKTLQVNHGRQQQQQQPLQRHHPSSERRSFYASSDLLLAGKGQNIYGSRPQQQQQQQQILNVFDIGRGGGGVGLTRTLNNHHRASNYYTSGTNGGHLSNNSSSNPTAATTTTASSSTLGLRVYSEAEVGVLQSLGKCKFGDVLLCNVPGSASTKGLRRLAVVRTVNDLNLKAEFVAAMSWARTRSLACDRFARLFGVIETPTYYASLTEAGDCDLHYYLRKTDYLSYETLLYIAGEIAAAGAYLEAASLPAVNGGSAPQQLQQQQEQTHRDIAARNVIIYEATLTVKLTDVAAYEEQWAADYVDGLPIRWMAPASVAGRGPLFSLPGDVYAFGVTLWEVMTGCKVRPFAEYGDEELVAAMYAYLDAKEEEEKASDDEEDNEDNDATEAPRLPVPTHCTPEIASLIEECTAAEERQRPTFKEICLFLQRKTAAAGSGKPH